MATTYLHRVLLGIPAARQAAIITWWNANLDAGQGAATWNVGLSATGTPPATFYWCSVALSDADLRTLILQLCQMSGVAAPAGWNTFTKAQKIAWIQNNAAAIQSGAGVRIIRDDNDGDWSDPAALLTAQGVRPIV